MSILNFDLQTAQNRIKILNDLPLPAEPYWYGLGYHILEWCGLPSSFPLRLQMHHGPMIEIEKIKNYCESQLPILLCHEGFASTLSHQPNRRMRVIGAPQVRYRRHQGITQSPDACGTIAFPCHSTHHIDVEFDHADYAAQLRTLPEEFQPVSVCMYFIDILKGRHIPYINAGLPVITAGHMADRAFTQTLYGFLQKARYTTGNEVGTHTILSLEMGIPYFHSGPDVSYRPGPGDRDRAEAARKLGKESLRASDFHRPKTNKLRSLIPNFTEEISISSELMDLIADIHSCDIATKSEDIKKFVLQSYYDFYPNTKILLDYAKKNGFNFDE